MAGNYENPYKSVKVRRGLKSTIPILDDGELGFCTDAFQFAVGYLGTNYFLPTSAAGNNSWSPHPTQGISGTPTAIAPSVGLPSVTTETWQWWFVETASGGAQNVTATPSIPSGSVVGQMLKLSGNGGNTNYPIFQDDAALSGSLLKLNGPWPATQDATLVLCWDGAAWAEESRK